MINWKYPEKELPPFDKSYRCLAEITCEKHDGFYWTGYADVYFSSKTGWRKCETEELVSVNKWILIEDLEKLQD